jgi:tetratricopeptide (TPR) repeat protein
VNRERGFDRRHSAFDTRFAFRHYRPHDHFVTFFGSRYYPYPRICYPGLYYGSTLGFAGDFIDYEPYAYGAISPTYVYPSYTYASPGGVAEPPEEPLARENAPEATDHDVDAGLTAFAAGRYEEAHQLFMRAVLSDEENAYAVVMYGLCDFALGDYPAAADAVRRAIRIDPRMIDAPPDFAAAYHQSGDLAVHVSQLEGYAAQRDESDAHLLLGFVYYGTGRPQQAASEFERAAQRDSQDSLAYLLRDAARAALQERQHAPQTAPPASRPETP